MFATQPARCAYERTYRSRREEQRRQRDLAGHELARSRRAAQTGIVRGSSRKPSTTESREMHATATT